MLQEIDSKSIKITPSAARAVFDILAEKKLEGYALRVYASGSGCCGIQFGMALDNNYTDDDTTIEAEGIKLVVDNASMEFLRGSSIDFVNDPQRGAGFTVDAPNANKQKQGDDCSCGGSCDCSH